MNQIKKAWTVVWTKKANEYGWVKPGDIVGADTDNTHSTEVTYPFFRTKRAAEEFRNGNREWKVVRLALNYKIYESIR